MTHPVLRGAGIALGVGLAAVLAVPSAQADTTVTIRPGDLNAVNSGTAGNGVLEFRADGVRLTVPDASGDFARAHFDLEGLTLDQVDAVDYSWIGTTDKPGVYYDIDLDGDGEADGELVGETIYGGTDVWLNRDVNQGLPGTSDVPEGTFARLAPCDGYTPRLNTRAEDCGASGSQYHGNLEDWARTLGAEFGSVDLVVGGFVASGIVQDGVLESITYGPQTIRFTDRLERASVSAEAARTTVRRGGTIKVTGAVDPVGEGATATLQRRTASGEWRDKESTDVRPNGRFALTEPSGKVGTVRLRVIVGATDSTRAATSNVVRVTVVRPAN